MPSSWTIYHNPRCSKSRATLAILHDAGIQPAVVEYLKDTPTAAELDATFRKLGCEPPVAMRFGEPAAKELGLHASDVRPRAEWLRLIVEHPILLERPIVIHGDTARIGRPPERVKELL
ncbi:MAG: arsenate reductase (glutaredoxin) [Nevskiaceae bacterium]|nr:MAG: arsenate reductase (glutaredoxin) [Nevskiaceae bacterium]TBR72013.1 MAG: arsenate reductase (glutaredoxin) [Nevskiaceae bacterium]